MSTNDITSGAILSVTGLTIYGLYYSWKNKRKQEYYRNGADRYDFFDNEKLIISLLLQDSSWIERLLMGILSFMKENYGYDLSINLPEIDAGNIDKDLFDYVNFLLDIHRMYSNFTHKIQSGENLDQSTFLIEWTRLFPIDGDLDTKLSIVDGVLKCMKRNLKEKITGFLQGKGNSTKTTYADFLKLLEKYKCINFKPFQSDLIKDSELKTIFDSN